MEPPPEAPEFCPEEGAAPRPAPESPVPDPPPPGGDGGGGGCGGVGGGGGEYIPQLGFGWTNGVALVFLNELWF